MKDNIVIDVVVGFSMDLNRDLRCCGRHSCFACVCWAPVQNPDLQFRSDDGAHHFFGSYNATTINSG